MAARPAIAVSVRYWLTACLAVPLLGSPQPCAALDLPLAPRGALIETLGAQLRLNGHPAQMQRLDIPASFDQALAHYRAALGARRVENRQHDWQVLGRVRDGEVLTLRLRAAGADRTEGWLLATRPDPAVREIPQFGFALPAGSVALSASESVDRRRRARMLMIENGHSPQTNREFIEQMLRQRGYQRATTSSAAADGQLLLFHRGQDDVMVGIHRQSATRSTVVINATSPE